MTVVAVFPGVGVLGPHRTRHGFYPAVNHTDERAMAGAPKRPRSSDTTTPHGFLGDSGVPCYLPQV